jgi:hypothetical protein
MDTEWKISTRQLILLFGFLFFSLGLLGIIQIGLLESLLGVVPYSLIILFIGITLLLIVIIKKLE